MLVSTGKSVLPSLLRGHSWGQTESMMYPLSNNHATGHKGCAKRKSFNPLLSVSMIVGRPKRIPI